MNNACPFDGCEFPRLQSFPRGGTVDRFLTRRRSLRLVETTSFRSESLMRVVLVMSCPQHQHPQMAKAAVDRIPPLIRDAPGYSLSVSSKKRDFPSNKTLNC